MRRNLIIMAVLFAVPLFSVRQLAAEGVTESVSGENFLSAFNPRTGLIDLPKGMAQLDAPQEFLYLGPEEAKRFLEEKWGNPDGSGTLGMLLPIDTDLLGKNGWAVVISYQEDGYVPDEDASQIDYDELLYVMKQETGKLNRKRVELSYQPVELIGWARTPRYDNLEKKLVWAKEFRFEGEEESMLNYNICILGRQGVLEMNAVSSMSQLPEVERRMGQVLAFSEFKEGYRYRDYDPGVDPVAAYGLAALIGGKAAAKGSLLAKLVARLQSSQKAVLAALAGFGALLAKFSHRRKMPAGTPATR
jgi:uncharacterized membrane-anchored protein